MEAAPIHTPRLRPRPASGEDLEALHALWSLPDVRRFLWDDAPVRREQVADWLARNDDSFRRHGLGLWLIEERPNWTLAGFCALVVDDAAQDAELAYGLAPHRWGHGIAAEAAAAAVTHALHVRHLPRLHATVDADNHRSIRILERLGMRRVESKAQREGALLWYELP